MNDARMSFAFSEDTGELIVRVQEPPRGDGHPGKSITFAGVGLQPLAYAELVQANPERRLTVSLEWDGARLVDTNIEGMDKSISYNAKASLESQFTSRAIGLVRGGWLPPALVASNKTTMLIDKNIVSQILGRFAGGKPVSTDPDFLDLFADRPLRINPILSAMEGNTRTIPTPDQVREHLYEVVPRLQAALPSAKFDFGFGSLTGALGVIEEMRAGLTRKQRFLMRVASSLAAPVSKTNMPARRDDVLAAADQCGVSRVSLVVLAALSTIYIANGTSPAKRLLKFKHGYSDEDAYNALADLRSLELLIHLFGLFPNEPAMLCTADRSLALFWTGIRASNFERHGAAARCNLSPIEELLPGQPNGWDDYIGK